MSTLSACTSFSIVDRFQGWIEQDCVQRRSPFGGVEPYERLSDVQERLEDPQVLLLANNLEDATSEDLPLARYLAQMRLDTLKNSLQIQNLESALKLARRTENGEWVLKSENDKETVADEFFDCVSRLSEGDPVTPIERLQAAFSGSPNPYFESSPFFYPEQYTLEDSSIDRFCVHAMIQA